MSFNIDSLLSPKSSIGRLIRLPLRFIPSTARLPILFGEMRGTKWIVRSTIYRCWFGIYEYQKQRLFSKVIKRNTVVYDIGANVGFYTILASKLVGNKGKVIAFEPLPQNVFYLKEHLKLNQVQNTQIVEAAVSTRQATARFQEGKNRLMGFLSEKGDLLVPVVAIDGLVNSGELPPPDYIKMDIEGAELNALKGCRLTLEKYHPAIFLATHGELIHKQCMDFLLHLGYSLSPIDHSHLGEAAEILAVHQD